MSRRSYCHHYREQEQHWIDATSDECLEEVRDVSAATDENLDLAICMVCNIQQAVSKAPQLIDNVEGI